MDFYPVIKGNKEICSNFPVPRIKVFNYFVANFFEFFSLQFCDIFIVMPKRCWEQLGERRAPKERHVQDGLFQIASQTCSLFMQINNTNNINYGDNNANIQLNGYVVS